MPVPIVPGLTRRMAGAGVLGRGWGCRRAVSIMQIARLGCRRLPPHGQDVSILRIPVRIDYSI